ncbi:MAG: hypothetical protein JKY61_05060 [Planctomycetes bacterium]|nr:hypothetical protein [Planctomycetota bacterium]
MKYLQIALIFIIGSFVLILGAHWAAGRFTKKDLLRLTPSGVDELVVFAEGNLHGQGLKLTDKEAIAGFLTHMRSMVKYSPNHERSKGHITVFLEPSGYHVQLAEIRDRPGVVRVSLVKMTISERSVSSYHYSNYWSTRLFPWYTEQLAAVPKRSKRCDGTDRNCEPCHRDPVIRSVLPGRKDSSLQSILEGSAE